MSRQRRKPPALPRSYADYEELGRLFQGVERALTSGTREEAAEALRQLYTKATIMWTPPSLPPVLPAGVSDLGTLREDVQVGRDHPPYGDFLPRLEEFRQFAESEYRQNKRRAEQRDETFVPDDEPDPPPFLK